MLQQHSRCLLGVAMITVALITSPLHAMVAREDGGVWILKLNRGVDLGSSDDEEPMAGQARIFSRGPNNELSSCLCREDTPSSGWCYLGEAVNGVGQPFNSSTAEPARQALLRCSLYVTVGKSYLYCNSRLVNDTSNCKVLEACQPKQIVIDCSEEKNCVAWCDDSGTVHRRPEENDPSGNGVKGPVKVTHHLGHDVIGVIAGVSVLCLLVIACCIVDKVRKSKYWILHFPKKRKLSTKFPQEEHPGTVSTITCLPSAESPRLVSEPSDPTSILSPGKQLYQKGQQKKNLTVQFRSASLPCSSSDLHHASHVLNPSSTPFRCMDGGSQDNITLARGDEYDIDSSADSAARASPKVVTISQKLQR